MSSFLKINIGCGITALKGWVNIDNSLNALLAKFPLVRKLLFKIGILDKAHYEIPWPKDIKFFDVRKRLPFKSNSVDIIYCSHLIEHLAKSEAVLLLKECYRVLQPGSGIMRIVVPDLFLIANDYLRKTEDLFKKGYLSVGFSDEFISKLGLFFEKRIRRSHRHKYMYDFFSLKKLLEDLDFVNIRKMNFQQSSIPDIRLLDNRPKESLYLEASKATD